MNLHDEHGEQHEQHDTQADLDNVDAEMARVLEEITEEAAAQAAPAIKVHLTPDDLEGLPEELIKELGLSKSDLKEMLTVDLNRMQRKGLLFSVPKSKGIYATRPVTDALSGDDADDVDDFDGEDDME